MLQGIKKEFDFHQSPSTTFLNEIFDNIKKKNLTRPQSVMLESFVFILYAKLGVLEEITAMLPIAPKEKKEEGGLNQSYSTFLEQKRRGFSTVEENLYAQLPEYSETKTKIQSPFDINIQPSTNTK
ncbi:hypothetical protein CDIK_2050 [Cucumispora dikerogammari]|nr:hypothetical protein CDIK_2050 [Cucumispora dikerogammari]